LRESGDQTHFEEEESDEDAQKANEDNEIFVDPHVLKEF